MAKDLKVSKKKSGELSSEVAQCNMRIRGLQEELRSEKEKNRLSNEHVVMLKENLESKQSSVVELKRMVSVEIMDAGEWSMYVHYTLYIHTYVRMYVRISCSDPCMYVHVYVYCLTDLPYLAYIDIYCTELNTVHAYHNACTVDTVVLLY